MPYQNDCNTVRIECCVKCHEHYNSIEHDEHFYHSVYQQIKNELKTAEPLMKVKKNIPFKYLSKVISKKIASVGKAQTDSNKYDYFDEYQNKVIRFPRIGSLEVYYQNIVIFSMISTDYSEQQLISMKVGSMIATSILKIRDFLDDVKVMQKLGSFRFLQMEWKPIKQLKYCLLGYVFANTPTKELTDLETFKSKLSQLILQNRMTSESRIGTKNSRKSSKFPFTKDEELIRNIVPYSYFGQNEKYSRIKSIYQNGEALDKSRTSSCQSKKQKILSHKLKSNRIFVKSKPKQTKKSTNFVKKNMFISLKKRETKVQGKVQSLSNRFYDTERKQDSRHLSNYLCGNWQKNGLKGESRNSIIRIRNSFNISKCSKRQLEQQQLISKISSTKKLHKGQDTKKKLQKISRLSQESYLVKQKTVQKCQEDTQDCKKSSQYSPDHCPPKQKQNFSIKEAKQLKLQKREVKNQFKERFLEHKSKNTKITCANANHKKTTHTNSMKYLRNCDKNEESLLFEFLKTQGHLEISQLQSIQSKQKLFDQKEDELIFLQIQGDLISRQLLLAPQDDPILEVANTKQKGKIQSSLQIEKQTQANNSTPRKLKEHRKVSIESQSSISEPQEKNRVDTNLRIFKSSSQERKPFIYTKSRPTKHQKIQSAQLQRKPISYEKDFIKKNIERAAKTKRVNNYGLSASLWDETKQRKRNLETRNKRNLSEKNKVHEGTFSLRQNHDQACRRCSKHKSYFFNKHQEQLSRLLRRESNKDTRSFRFVSNLSLTEKISRQDLVKSHSRNLSMQGIRFCRSAQNRRNIATIEDELQQKQNDLKSIFNVSSSKTVNKQKSLKQSRFLDKVQNEPKTTIKEYLRGLAQKSPQKPFSAEKLSQEQDEEEELFNPFLQKLECDNSECNNIQNKGSISPGEYNYQMFKALENSLQFENAHIFWQLSQSKQAKSKTPQQIKEQITNNQQPAVYSHFNQLLISRQYARLQYLSSQNILSSGGSPLNIILKPLSQTYKLDEIKLFPLNFSCSCFSPEQTASNREHPTLLAFVVKLLLKMNPKLITRLFENSSQISWIGFYCVWLFTKKGKFEPIYVNDEFAQEVSSQNGFRKKVSFLHSGLMKGSSIWYMLLQKAAAKLLGGYESLEAVSFADLFRMLTGGQILEVRQEQMYPQKLFKMLDQKLFSNKRAYVYAISGNVDIEKDEKQQKSPIERISGVNYNQKNPYYSLIHFESKTNRISSIPFIDFIKEFSEIAIAFFNPNFYFNNKEIVYSKVNQIRHQTFEKVLEIHYDKRQGEEAITNPKTCIISVENMAKVIDITKIKMFYERDYNHNSEISQYDEGKQNQRVKNYQYNGEISRKGKFFFEFNLYPGSNLCNIQVTLKENNTNDFEKLFLALAFYSEGSIEIQDYVEEKQKPDFLRVLNGQSRMFHQPEGSIMAQPTIRKSRMSKIKIDQSQKNSVIEGSNFLQQKLPADKKKDKRKKRLEVSRGLDQGETKENQSNFSQFHFNMKRQLQKERIEQISQRKRFLEDEVQEGQQSSKITRIKICHSHQRSSKLKKAHRRA